MVWIFLAIFSFDVDVYTPQDIIVRYNNSHLSKRTVIKPSRFRKLMLYILVANVITFLLLATLVFFSYIYIYLTTSDTSRARYELSGYNMPVATLLDMYLFATISTLLGLIAFIDIRGSKACAPTSLETVFWARVRQLHPAQNML